MKKLSSNTEEDGTESITVKMSSDQRFQDELSSVSDVSEDDDEIELIPNSHESSPRFIMEATESDSHWRS